MVSLVEEPIHTYNPILGELFCFASAIKSFIKKNAGDEGLLLQLVRTMRDNQKHQKFDSLRATYPRMTEVEWHQTIHMTMFIRQTLSQSSVDEERILKFVSALHNLPE